MPARTPPDPYLSSLADKIKNADSSNINSIIISVQSEAKRLRIAGWIQSQLDNPVHKKYLSGFLRIFVLIWVKK